MPRSAVLTELIREIDDEIDGIVEGAGGAVGRR